MARIKYYDSVTQQWVYGDMALQPPLPTGTANGDILVWDNTNQEWVVKPKWQIHFQPVEYIESTGTQRIDTGIKTTNGVIIDFQYTSATNDSSCFGAMTNNTTNRYDIIYYDGLYFSCGNGADVSSEITGDATRRILLEQGVTNQDLKIDGTTIATYPAFTNGCTYNTHLFARKQGSSSYKYASVKIYSCKLYVDGTLQRDFVPCYRISDSVIGMYDTVNGVFYTNAGSGTFTKGADV